MSKLENWQEEKRSAYLYRHMADVETRHAHRGLFLSLAEAADLQAEIWAEQIRRETGEGTPPFYPSLRAQLVVRLIHVLGPRRIRPILAAMKVRGMSVYNAKAVQPGHPMPTTVEEIGHRHKGVESGGNLRAAVFGVNDGLVSNASLIMGVAGATHDVSIIYLSGVAGMLAGACSMAAGEYVSMQSQRELFEYQIGLEREELEEYPDEEAEELAVIYNARGVPMEHARAIARKLMQDPEHALDTLAREELGLNPDELGSPWGAALSSFTAFALGAFVPLVPFVLGFGGVAEGALLTLASLFLVGATLSLFTGRSALISGIRMVLIGGGAGMVTYIIGTLLGVTVL